MISRVTAPVDPVTLLERLDGLIIAQLSEILADPAFRALESAWRGLWHLVSEVVPGGPVRIRLLSVNRREIEKEMLRSAEVAQSALWQLLVEEPATTFGAPLYGLLVSDLEVSNHPSDLGLLVFLTAVAEGAGAPLVAGGAPGLFAVRSFAELRGAQGLEARFGRLEYGQWRRFRDSGGGSSPRGSSFAALTVPGAQLRRGWANVDLLGAHAHVPAGTVDGPLRASAAWAWAACVTRAHEQDGWFAEIAGHEGGATPLQAEVSLWPPATAPSRTAAAVADELSDLGFLPLVPVSPADDGFLGSSSCAAIRRFETPARTLGGNRGRDLAHVLSCLRFVQAARAFYRDASPPGVGWTATRTSSTLNEWLGRYVPAEQPSLDETASRPLHEARVKVEEVPGRPGFLRASFFLGARHGLEPPTAALLFQTTLRPRPR